MMSCNVNERSFFSNMNAKCLVIRMTLLTLDLNRMRQKMVTELNFLDIDVSSVEHLFCYFVEILPTSSSNRHFIIYTYFN